MYEHTSIDSNKLSVQTKYFVESPGMPSETWILYQNSENNHFDKIMVSLINRAVSSQICCYI